MIIGVEVELHSEEYSADYIADEEGLNFHSFTYLKGMKLGVKLSREYYSSTIEYNFTPFENSIEAFNEIKTFLEGQINKYNLYKHSDGPAYVGTHIHIFDEDKINMKIGPLLEGVSGFLINNINSIEKKGLSRLLFAHQLWGNFSWKQNHIWKKFLNDNGKGPNIYDNTREKPKYNPIIYSPANSSSGKPNSLEIRLIPNEYIFNLKAFELMQLIDKKTLSKNKKSVIDLYGKLYEGIFNKKPQVEGNNFIAPTRINLPNSFIFDENNSHFEGTSNSNNNSNSNSEEIINFNNKLYTKNNILSMLNYYSATGSYSEIISVEGITKENYIEFIDFLNTAEAGYNLEQYNITISQLKRNIILNFTNPF